MHFVYVIRSKRNGWPYVGVTSDPKRRLEDHNRGKVRSTRDRRPFELVHTESYIDGRIARRREIFFKTGKGREVLRNIFEARH